MNWDKIIYFGYPYGRNLRKWLAVIFMVIVILSWYKGTGINFDAVFWRVLDITIRWKHIFTVFGILLIQWFRKPLKGLW